MAEGNGDKLVQATPRERSKKYPSDATVTKEYCQNTAEAGASEIHFVFDPATNERTGMPIPSVPGKSAREKAPSEIQQR